MRLATCLLLLAAVLIPSAAWGGANHGAAIMIEAGVVSKSTSCLDLQRASCWDIHPVIQVPAGANNYFAVYVAQWLDNPLYVTGIDFGITYGDAVVVTAWNKCGDLEVPAGNWPASNSGDSVVWASIQTPGPILVGWFRITTYDGYGPMTMTLGVNPTFNACRVLDGASNFDDLRYPATGSLDGTWAANPECEGFPIQPTTWGAIKSRYD